MIREVSRSFGTGIHAFAQRAVSHFEDKLLVLGAFKKRITLHSFLSVPDKPFLVTQSIQNFI